ncbi:hypothetical protein [Novosphingobium cyanobacteriorum]|uniref:Uncharacterized protein n=1 Tax=Novosphingobium cyanobacteriorum TaxID=3024215 RepID=A0ABT6CJA5_9SPHN|nr:hypothetical protein [Novosphingobium cyanobacteriorum]MDF8333971.1 hypothetical protein [Novosphingobium cyanobacteriorum]
MERQGEEIHITTPEARGGETTGIMRYVLIIALVLAIGALSIIWITGALTSPQPNSTVVSGQHTPAPAAGQ